MKPLQHSPPLKIVKKIAYCQKLKLSTVVRALSSNAQSFELPDDFKEMMTECIILSKIGSIVQDESNSSLCEYYFVPFSQSGGLGIAHQLFCDQLTMLLEELNEVLAA